MDPSSKLEQTNFPGHGDSALKPAEQQAFRHRQTITQAFKRCPRKIRVSRNDGNFKQKGSLQAHRGGKADALGVSKMARASK